MSIISQETDGGRRRLWGMVTNSFLVFCLLVPGPVAADQVAILDSAADAIDARIDILKSAEKSIEVMYFSIHDDVVTQLVLGLMRDKALQGVNVRIITAANGFKVERPVLFHLQTMDNFEIRLYNAPKLSEPLRVFRQLHDKLLLVDEDRYNTGGRNLGQVYFNMAEKKNKLDRDLYVIGDSARTAREYFDDLWDSSYVKPAEYAPYTVKQMSPDYCEMVRKIEGMAAYNRCVKDYNQRVSRVNAAAAGLEELVHDPVEGKNRHTGQVLGWLAAKTDGKILIQTPYVVPTRGLYAILELKKAEGVPVIFVTNSIKSTANVVAHSTYLRYRKRMIDLGATFIESTGDQMLHAKSMVLRNKDGSCVGMVGSFNIDPRSATLNTEIVCLVHDCDFVDEPEKTIMRYAEGGLVIASREDIKKTKALKRDIPLSKRFQMSILKFLAPLYRGQV